MSGLGVRGVSMSFGPKRVLHDVSFEVARGSAESGEPHPRGPASPRISFFFGEQG